MDTSTSKAPSAHGSPEVEKGAFEAEMAGADAPECPKFSVNCMSASLFHNSSPLPCAPQNGAGRVALWFANWVTSFWGGGGQSFA